MSNRVTEKDLEMVVHSINELTGNPITTHSENENGGYRANIGNYHLSFAYGCVSLEQTCNDGGGVRRVFGSGTKRELINEMWAFQQGLREGKELAVMSCLK